MSKPRQFTAVLILLSVVLILTVHTQAQTVISGPNVNMVSGTTWPDGDPYLQRQNEPSIAVSTRNSLHLLAASNDYRTVDLPGLPDGLPIADSWIGVYTSLDGGGSWTSTLLPGYPQDDAAVGQASPVYGMQAAADPVMRAGTHGMFYLSGIVFDRGATPESKLFVARYVDLNNDPATPIQYIDTVEVASYSFPSNVFIDKPWLAVDVPGGSATSTTFYVEQAGNSSSPVAQAVECGNLYLTWAEIESVGDTVVESRILSSTSMDCGSTWSSPIQLSDPGTINQGAVVAVSPNPGNVYVAWRQLTGLGVTGDCGRGPGYWTHHLDWPTDALTMTLGGVAYDTQTKLLEILESPGGAKGDARLILARQLIAAKLNHFDVVDPAVAGSMASADVWLAENPIGPGPKPKKDVKTEGTDLAEELTYYNLGVLGPVVCGTAPPGTSDDAIIVTASTTSGTSFDSPPTVVRYLESYEPFDQATTEWTFRTTAYPTMTVDAAGRVYIAWSERGEALATADPDPIEGDSRIMVATLSYSSSFTELSLNPIDQPEVPGHQIQPSISFVNDHLFLVYNDFRQDYSGVFDRFVMDLMTPTQPYRHTVDIRAAVAYPGASPVFTDYSLLPSEPSTQASKYLFMPTIQGGVLIFEQLDFNPPNLPMFKAGTVPFYGDYVDIAGLPFVPDGMGGWTYNTSSTVEPIAHAVWTDNRDVIGPADGDWTSFVPLGSGGTSVFDGTTVVPPCVAETDDVNRTGMRNQNIYTSRLTTGLYVAVPGNSRPLSSLFQRGFVVFVQNGTDAAKSFSLEFLNQPAGGSASLDQFSSLLTDEVDLLAYSSASRTVFATSTDPVASIAVQVTEIDPVSRLLVAGGLAQTVLINPDPSNPGPSDPTLLAGEVYNPAVLNPAVYNPAVYNPAVLNPAVFNPAVFNPAVFNPAVFNDAVLNYSVDNPAVFNPAVLNPAVYNPAVFNPAVFNEAVLAMSLMNPAVYNPAVLNPAVFNPAVLNPAVFNPAVFNPAVLNPAVLNPAVFNPAVFNPAVLNPAVMNPAVLNPAVYNTTFADGSATDLNLVAQNDGNATSAYSLNLNLLNQMSGFHYQLMIYRIYFTPVANDCQLTEAAQQEILVNDLDPDLAGYLLDPYSDASFYLNPGDYAVATLRITPDPDAPVPGDPSNFNPENISASVVAQAVNSDAAANGETQPAASAWLAPNLPPLVITTTTLANATQGAAYLATLTAAGGSGPLTWSLAPGSGPLPTGLTISAAGVIAGTPAVPGTFNITVRTTDYSQIAEQPLTLTVDPGGSTITFVTQPGSTTAGQPIAPFSVRVADATYSPLPGVTVDLAISSYGCSTASMVPAGVSAVTDLLGIATFFGVTIDRGGAGYTFQVTASTNLAESAPFNLIGFCETATMGTPRAGQTETLLADGRVLLTGGQDGTTSPTGIAQIYDPFTDTFSSVPGGLAGVRIGHTATRLADGRVLIAGGSDGTLPLTSALIFDPASDTFSPTGGMSQIRDGHTATRLADGRVFIAGGNAAPYATEIYDPSTGTFGSAAALSTARRIHTATLLPDGRVLIVGGDVGGYVAQNTIEIYDPTINAFTTPAGSNMGAARMDHTATLLADGRVLVAGGVADVSTTHATSEIFDPATDSFTLSVSLGGPRTRHAAAALADGTVLLIGGKSASSPANALASTEIFDPTAGTSAASHGLSVPRTDFSATLLSDGKVFVAGGYDAPSDVFLDTTETFWPITGETVWTRQFGSTEEDYIYSVSSNMSGVYVAGYSSGTLPDQTSGSGLNAFVRKYDLLGTEAWTHQFGNGASYLWGVSVIGSDVYVTGFTNGALPGQASAGGTDVFVRKYDAAGIEVWTRQFGTAGVDQARGISVDASGVYMAGFTSGTFPTQVSAGGQDAFIRKYDFAGSELWTRQFGTGAADSAWAISVDASGVYVTGYTTGAFPTQTNAGGEDVFIRKFDYFGNELWTRQFGTTGADQARGLSTYGSGVYVVGTTFGTLPGQSSEGIYDAFVRKYDWAGAEVWTRQFGSPANDYLWAVSADSSGIWAAGSTDGALPGQVSSGGTDAFLRKYDPTGTEVWTRQFGTSLIDRAHAVSVDASGAYLTGDTDGILPGQTSSGSRDAFVARIADSGDFHGPIIPGGFLPTGSLATARSQHTATSLISGEVLVAGGTNIAGAVGTAEVFDSLSGAFTTLGGGLVAARYYHTATRLFDGRVLLSGGVSAGGAAMSSAELFDPGTNTFGPTSGMVRSRRGHSATLLADGRVLVVGGGGVPGQVAELYDPTLDSFSDSGTMSAARSGQTATFLPDGTVLITGGWDGSSALSSAEVYDPVSGTFSPTAGSMATPRHRHTATLLPNGKVLIAGGGDGGVVNCWSTAELYDPGLGTFVPTGSLLQPRCYPEAVLLPSGKVLVAGGRKYGDPTPLTVAEIYDPATGLFQADAGMGQARHDHTATLLEIGKVLLSGGWSGGYLNSAELYIPGPP